MARKRTRNYREERADFSEEDEERRDDEEGEEEEEEDEEGDEEEEEGTEGEAEGEGEGDEDDEEAPKKKKKVKPKAKPKPKRTRAAKVTRMRMTWGVFNNSNQMVAQFDYPQKEEAEAEAAKRMADKKSTHFVQPVKEPIEEKKDDKK
ncbi:MAG TPA: hypothetical protein VFE62_27460 [Gemmataceae bacterium]|nr:hypothetical protein [Gemmataceae bacterium]